MSKDHLQMTDGMMAKLPKVSGGVVMERESMLRKSMNGMLRVALVGVMAMVFGLAGFVSNAEAVLVEYWLDQDTGTTVATGITTGFTATECTNEPAGLEVTLASKDVVGSCASRWDVTAKGDLGEVYYNTAYATDTTITGQASGNVWYLRERSDAGNAIFTIEVFYVLANGAETSLGSGTVDVPTSSQTDYDFDLSSVSGTAPAGSKLGYRISWSGGSGTAIRAQFGSGNGVANGDIGYITVDETAGASCTANNPTVSISTAPATITSDGGSAVYNYFVTNNDTAACADRAFALTNVDSAVTNFDASVLSAGTTGNLASGATYNGTLTTNATAGQTTGSVTSTITASQGGDSGNDAVITTLSVVCTPTGSILWNGTTTANGDFTGASLVGSTSNISGNVEYQVTGSGGNWGSCRTESGRATLTGTGGTVTLGTTILDLSQAFVLVDSTHADAAGNSNEFDFAATGEITDSNTLTFTREGTASDLEVSYQLVECFNNEFNVQRGDITLTGAATTNTASVTAVDTTKSMVIVNSRSSNNANENNQNLITGEMTNGTTVTVTRDAGSANAVAHYQVVEFDPSAIVSLQTGEVSVSGFLATPTTVNLGTAVNDGTSWLYFTKAAAVAGMDDVSTAGNLTNAGADLKFYHESEGTSRIRWYVVEFPNDGTVKVQRGLSSFAGGADPATHNITVPVAVNATAKAFPYVTSNTLGNGSAFPRHLWVERLSSTSNIELQGWNTDTANADANMEWQVVEFIDGGGGSTPIPWSTDPLSPTPSSVMSNGDYNIYVRALDATCGSYVYGDPAATNTTADGAAKAITWSSCSEANTVNAPTFAPSATPILGDVVINATGNPGAGTITVSWSENGGSTWSSWVATGSTYTPSTCTSANVIFRARGTSSCGGDLITEATPVAFDTTETATVTLDAVTDPITGDVTISATLGGSGGTNIEVSDDDATWQASPWSYSPPADAEGSLTFYAQATGTCGTVSDATPTTVSYDTLAPTVSSTVPVNGADPVTKDNAVTINFNGTDLDCNTVDTSSVTISPVPATSWTRTSCSTSQAVFAPVGQVNSTLYTVSIDNTVADLVGNTMTADSFSYTTDCTDSIPSSLGFNAVTTASGDFAGASMVTPVDLTNLEFRVTETAPGGASAVSRVNWGAGIINNATYSYTVGAGTDRLLVIAVSNEDANLAEVTGVTYGGQTVLPINEVTQGAGYSNVNWVGYCDETCIAAAGNTDIVASWGGDGMTNSTIFAATYEGVDQTTPYNDSAVNNSGNSTISVTVNNVEGGMVIYSVEFNDVGDTLVSPPGGFTSRGVLDTAGTGFRHGVGDRNITTAGTVTVTPTNGGTASDRSTLVAIALNPAAGGPVETTLYDWNSDPQSAMTGEAPANAPLDDPITAGNKYTIYARGVDAECGGANIYVGGGALPGTGKDFTWTSCIENKTVALDTIPATITANTTIQVTAGSDATGMQVGDTAPPAQSSPWTYIAPQDSTAPVTFYAEGTGDCGTMTDSFAATLSTMAAPAITNFTVSSPVVDTGAPYDIPIDTFNAIDNVAVTGFMITVDDNTPSGSWTGTAPTSVNVPGYDTYTLYAWARDTAGNVSSASTQTVTVVNCTPGTVTFDNLVPEITTSTYDFSGHVAIVDSGDSTVSNPQYSIDGGGLVSTGTVYTLPTNDKGTFDISFEADDTCSTTVYASGNPYAISYDTRVNSLTVLPASASLQGINSVLVTMPYQGDKDGNATFQYQYQENTGGYGAWTAPVTDADNTSPKTFTISGLTLDALVDINVRYLDAGIDHNGNVDPQPLQVQLVSWVDSNLLHNSNRFACSEIGFFSDEAACVGAGGTWTYDKKHTVAGNGSEWGTSATGDVTGPILCNTCHKAGSGNIKRITDLVSFSTGAPPNGGGAVSAAEAVPGTSSDYGDDSVAHNPSTKICEVCHSQNQFHNSDRAQNGGGNLHQNNNDCIDCHLHTGGFRASCAACHGNPPVDAGTLATSTPTNSVTAGAHDEHVNTLTISCEVCHYNSVGGGSTHDTGSVTIGFVGLPDPTAAAALKLDGGSYDGQSAVNGYDTTDAGGLTTTVTTGDALTCANYCHGSTINGTSPAWNAVAPTMCGTCHGDDAASASTLPSGTSHNTHANAQGLACIDCHGSGAGGSGHLDGEIVWNLAGLSGTTETYRSSIAGQTGAVAPSGTYGTCSNISCHNNVDTPTWDNGPASCTTCHAAPPNTNAHAAHYTAKGWSGDASCDNCHPDNTAGHSDVTDGTILVDAALEWNSSTCFGSGGSITGCHNGNTSPAWNAGTITCTNCHTVGGTNSATVANPETGLHGNAAVGVQDHDNTLSGGCEACHVKANISQHWNGVASATPSYTEAQSGVNTLPGGSYVDNAGTGANRGTCTTTCHTDNGNWSRQWSTEADSTSTVVGNARCDVCHGQWTTWAAGTTHYKAGGTNSASNTRGNGHDCANCHAYVGDALHDNNAINVNNNGATPGRTNNTYGSGTAGCGICHGNQTDSTKNFPISYFSATYVSGGAVSGPSCNSCHDSAVAAGKGAPAVDSTTGTHIDADGTGGTYTSGTCEDCHTGHANGTPGTNHVEIPTSAATFAAANKYTTHSSAIYLGGAATNVGAWYADSANPTEAEMCWGCHNDHGNNVSEWGANAGTGSSYNYGSLNQPNWNGAIWTSNNFTYKTGMVRSTHSANSSGATNGVDNVADIRCSNCHDVHNTHTDTVTLAPYTRGTWLGNPYKEDGAPQSGNSYNNYNTESYGLVPRGSANVAQSLGGYWIDQNSGNPVSGDYNSFGGLCQSCHGTDIDALNYYGTNGAGWVSGYNGHANSVKGGSVAGMNATEETARNIFDARGGVRTGRNGFMSYYNFVGPGDNNNAGMRGGDRDSWSITPGVDSYGSEPFANEDGNENGGFVNEWDDLRALDMQGTITNTNYHTFSCSKCHNPHASRLPKLMITNCLDTKQNQWDNGIQAGTAGPLVLDNVSASGWTTAQNCHRLVGNDTADANDANGTNAVGAGWNLVTPWTDANGTYGAGQNSDQTQDNSGSW